MRVNKVDNRVGFQGRIGRFDIDNKKVYQKMLDSLDYSELNRIGIKLRLEEQRNMPVVKKSFFGELKELFFPPKKEEPKKISASEKLQEAWNESTRRMKDLVINKLPDEYVLRCNKTDLSPSSMDFRITKGREQFGGVSASINDPKFPERFITEYVEIISDSNFEKKVSELKEIFPELTDNTYIVCNERYTRSDVQGWLKTNKDLKQIAAKKKLKLSIQFVKNEHGNHQAKGLIKSKDGKILFESFPDEAKFDDVANELSAKLESL